MVLLVVVLHAAISYGKFVPWWFVKDAGSSVFFDILMLTLDSFLMPMLYLIAGFFAISSFQKNGPVHFLKGKFRRLGLPILVGIPLVSPSAAYLYHYTRKADAMAVTFPEYWAAYMQQAGDLHVGVIRSIDHFAHSHFWFMSLLLCFFVLFAGYAYQRNWHRTPEPVLSGNSMSGKSILVILLAVGFLSAVSTFTAKMLFASPANPQPWISIGPFLMFEPERVIMYMLYFGMGVVAYYKKWFTRSFIPGHPVVWPASALVLFIGLLSVVKPLMEDFSEEKLLVFVFFRSFFCVCMLVVFTKAAASRWNDASRAGRLLARNSYYIYMIHYLVVLFLQLALVSWSGGSVFIKFGIVVSASILISFGISHYMVRPYPRQFIAGLYGIFIAVMISAS